MFWLSSLVSLCWCWSLRSWQSRSLTVCLIISGLCPGEEDWGQLTPTSMLNHQKWLPEHADKYELDLEAELNHASAHCSANSSRRGSLDRVASFANRIRLPPSGRSSVDRGSGDTPRQTIDHAALVKSFGCYPESSTSAALTKSSCSEESGFQDGNPMEASTCSSNSNGHSSQFTTSVLTLSPVHEAKEPGSASTSPIHRPKTGLEPKCNKNLFHTSTGDEDKLTVVVEQRL